MSPNPDVPVTHSLNGWSFGANLRAWYAVALFCIAQIVSTIDRGMLALVVDPVRADLGISDVQIALLQGFAFSIFYVIAGVILGLVADVVNRKRLLIAGICVWSVATIASGLAQSFGQMFAARLLIGVGEAVLAPCAVTMIADLFPVDRRGRPMALYIFGSMIAFGVGSVAVGFVLDAAPKGAFDFFALLQDLAPWRIAFVLAGIVGLGVAMLFVVMEEPRRRSPRTPSDSASLRDGVMFMLHAWRLYLPLYMTLAFFGMGIAVVLNWSPVLMSRVFSYAIDDVSKMLGVGHIVWAALGSIMAGFIIDRAVKRWNTAGLIWLGAGMSILSIPACLAVFVGHGTLAVIMLSSVTFASALFGSAMLSAVPEIAPARTRGLAVALYAFFMTLIGFSVGPFVVAYLTEHVFRDEQAVGYSVALAGSISFGIAAMLACVSASRHGTISVKARAVSEEAASGTAALI